MTRGYDRSPPRPKRLEKRHRWDRDNHTKTESVCVDCGLHRRALPVTEDSGITQYFIAGKWLKARAPSCPGRKGIHESPHPIAKPTLSDSDTIQAWLDKIKGRTMRGTSDGVKLTLASGFSRRFLSIASAADFIRSKKEG